MSPFFGRATSFLIILLHLLQQNNKNNMALVSKKDFAIALGVPYGTIRSKFSRKQLCCNRKGLIDTEHPTNFAYLLEVNGGNQIVFDSYHISGTNLKKKSSPATKEGSNLQLKPKKNVEVPKIKDIPLVNKTPKLTLEERKALKEQQETNKTLASFDIRKRLAEVELAERKSSLAQWELEKKAGNTLPLDMIENMIAINYKAVFKSMQSQLKNIAMVMVQQLGGDKNDLNSILIEMENILDKTVSDSKKKASVDIDKLIDEYSEIRSRGERKA